METGKQHQDKSSTNMLIEGVDPIALTEPQRDLGLAGILDSSFITPFIAKENGHQLLRRRQIFPTLNSKRTFKLGFYTWKLVVQWELNLVLSCFTVNTEEDFLKLFLMERG